ncbi:T9SS type A sorting domain-containing protein [Kaistella flava (ex Peng et al. 2021)]|uniref:T9SS type A sorting domain-containing protein n=1 Tax=Kaistella flava (ex Peng et al. 2021) TaxID=2038776 RepID=A0A7M2YDF6_9FLAO|nr:ice-binding family protein [Kaistella flava (ex Peng et al. 2021)]QOW11665.1 T9SS type A sorting domain-containing protein [Kaistella flava (ex Peng et al. 2021)]
MKKFFLLSKLLSTLVAAVLFLMPSVNFGQAPNLGSASSFALFTAAGAFNNTGAGTIVTGDVGTNVGAFNAFPPGTLIGQKHHADLVSSQAAIDVAFAYGSVSTVTCGSVISTTMGSGQTLLPNVYCLGAASTINGDLILDGGGDPNSIFIFKIDGALATTVNSRVLLTNGASLCNVYWQVNGEVDLGDNSLFQGTILADGAINLLQGATLNGRGLSTAGAISLSTNTVTLSLQPTASVITAGGATTFCAGGSVTLSGNSGGTWSTGATTSSITVNTSGDYFVTNTNACGSVNSNHIIVTVNPLPAATAGRDTSICSGNSVTLGTSPVSGHTYSWTPSTGLSSTTIANPVASPTTTTTYTLVETITATGCQNTNSVTVTVSPAPVASVITAGGATAFCTGGSVTLSGNSGGTWSTGATTPSITVTTSGDYFVTNTNACGSVNSNHIIVTVSPAPVASVITAGGATTFCAGGSVTLSGNSGGTWSTGATTATITVNTSGDYFVTNTNACGSVNSNHIIVTVNPLPAATAGRDTAICSGNSVTLGTTPVSGHTYLWTPSTGLSSATIANPVASPTTTTTYTLVETITATGCQNTNSVTVTVSPAPVASVITAGGATTFCAGGSVTLSGNSGGTWSTGATTATIIVTTSGDYFVTNTNACGSVNSNHITVTVSPAAVASVITAGGATTFCAGGSVILSGNSGGTWSTGATTATITATTSGDYFVTNTNACGSVNSNHIIVTVSPAPVVSVITAGGATTFCAGGSVILSGNSGGTWSTGATTPTITVTTSGDYFVTNTNACGSVNSNHIIVTVSPAAVASVITAGGATTFCAGGSVTLSGNSGGTWSTGATTATITVTTSGDYFVTNTNACGSVNSNHIIVTVSPLPVCTITGNSVICQGQSTQLCAPAGFTKYLWSTGATTSCITVSTAGTYTVTTTNAAGCTSTGSKTVTVSALPVCTITGNSVICQGQSTQLCAPAGFTKYLWSTGATTSCITVSTAGTYTVTTTNAAGCTSTCSKTVTVSSLPVCTITGDSVICQGQSTQLCAPAGFTKYLWSTGATTSCITVSTADTYTVTTTNAAGCTSTGSKTVTVSALPVCTITGNSVICQGQSTQLCAPAGFTKYLWSTGATTSCITVSTAGTYTVTTTNAAGCTSTCSKTVTVSALPVCTITGDSVICQGQSTQLCAPAGFTKYLWSTGATTSCITVSTAGTYTVTTTNAAGCTSTCSKTVTVSSLPVCTITGNSVICQGQSTQLCAPAGFTKYLWSTGATTSCITVSTAGTYTVTTTNAAGCTSTGSKTVTVSALPVCTITGNSVICQGQSTQLCAPAGFTKYLWSTGATTSCITVSTAGTYTVTTTNAAGCTSTCSKTVTVSSLPVCTITGDSVICQGQSTQLCAPAGFTKYLWSTGATTSCITVSTAGTYTVTTTNAAGCTSTGSKTVTVTKVEVHVEAGSISCNGGESTVKVTATGGTAPYTGVGTFTVKAGTHTYTVKDAKGCSVSKEITITEPSKLVVHIEACSISCNGGESTVKVTATGGTAPYTGVGTFTVKAGTHTYTVKDAKGCSVSKEITITEPSKLVVHIEACSISCNGGESTVKVTATGGTAPYTGVGTFTAKAGTHTYTVKDAKGCSGVKEIMITQPEALNLVLTIPPANPNGLTTVKVTVSGGTPVYKYLWSNGETGSSANLGAGLFSVTVTDYKGCKATIGGEIKPIDCGRFTTVTQGGWGAKAAGNNWGAYRNQYFAGAFPAGLTVGAGSRFLKLTTAKAVEDFLPSGSTPRALDPGTLTNPGASYANVLAGQVVALTLNVRFDEYDANFSPSSTKLGDMVVASGTFAGMSVYQVLAESNKVLGGISVYSASKMNSIVDEINNNYDGGMINNHVLTCPCPEPGLATGTNDILPVVSKMVLYPNPSDGEFNIKFDAEQGTLVLVQLFDMSGKLIGDYSNKVIRSGNKANLNVKNYNLVGGSYVVKVKTSTSEKTFKLLIKK